MKVVKRKISELKPSEYNPRRLTKEQEKHLTASLSEFGLVDPIVVNINPERKDIIIGGHQRLKVWRKLGNKEIDCVELDLSAEKERELNIRLNANTGEWDEELLQEFFQIEELQDWGLDFEWKVDEDEAEEDDFDTTPPEEPKTVLGDIYEIGEHRLLCGDSTDSDQVAKLMNGEKADMVFTDPPYGMFLDTDYSEIKGSKNAKISGGGKSYSKVIGDHNDFTPELIHTIFACFSDVKDIFIWGADYFAELIPDKNNGSWIVWDKRGSEDADKIVGSSFELCWSKEKHKRLIARIKWMGAFGSADARNRVHPTQKPIKLAEWFFNQWGNKDDLIADLFLGSGTTMAAAHQLNRKCYGMEIEPKYCQIIIDRMRNLDPNLVIKKNGIEI